MKKEGIVIQTTGQYLEVLPLENVSCNLNEKETLSDNKTHSCYTCSRCSPINQKSIKTISVLNKSGKDIKAGEKITYSLSFTTLQFFIVVLLPFISFGLTFSLLNLYSYKENICILSSFLVLLLTITLNFIFTRRVLKKMFTPFV